MDIRLARADEAPQLAHIHVRAWQSESPPGFSFSAYPYAPPLLTVITGGPGPLARVPGQRTGAAGRACLLVRSVS